MLSQTAELLQRKHYPLWAQLMRCCGKPQAVRGRVGSSLLDSGVPLPPVVCPGSSAKRVHCRGSGTKWRNPAVTSEPPRHLQWRPVWELVLPGQWNKRRRESFSFLWLTETVETNTWSQQSTFKNSLDSPRDSYYPQVRPRTNKHHPPVPCHPQCQQHRPGRTVHFIINDVVYLLCCLTKPRPLREATHTFKPLRSNVSFTSPSLHLIPPTLPHGDSSPHPDTLN